MMLTMLKDWKGAVEINGTRYENIQSAISENKRLSNDIHIKLYTNAKKSLETQNTKRQTQVNADNEVRITVKQYMTKKATPEFDFMAKWNNDIPMPLRTMQGKKIKETPGMVYMELHAKGIETITCLRCGKELTHPVSRHYGIGPECMKKLGIIADIDAVDKIKEKLIDIKWSGWVIKSSILKEEEV